jgi:hypothetical protein
MVQQLIETHNQSFVKLDKTWKEHINFKVVFVVAQNPRPKTQPTIIDQWNCTIKN